MSIKNIGVSSQLREKEEIEASTEEFNPQSLLAPIQQMNSLLAAKAVILKRISDENATIKSMLENKSNDTN